MTLLKEKTDALDREDNLDVQAECLTEIITNSYFDSCRLVTTKKKTKPPWWNGELTRLKKEAARFRNKYIRNPTEENKIAKKDSLRKFTLEMQYAKRKGWKNFCSEMQDLSTN